MNVILGVLSIGAVVVTFGSIYYALAHRWFFADHAQLYPRSPTRYWVWFVVLMVGCTWALWPLTWKDIVVLAVLDPLIGMAGGYRRT